MTELINRRARVYAPPAKLKAHEPESDIRAIYQATPWQHQHDTFVRGVKVCKLSIREGDNHVWCLFPDGRTMIVAEKNIRAIKLSKYTGAVVHEQAA